MEGVSALYNRYHSPVFTLSHFPSLKGWGKVGNTRVRGCGTKWDNRDANECNRKISGLDLWDKMGKLGF